MFKIIVFPGICRFIFQYEYKNCEFIKNNNSCDNSNADIQKR